MLWTLTAPVTELPVQVSKYAPKPAWAPSRKKYHCLAGNRTTLNGSVIILPRYPNTQRAGRSRSRIPARVKFSAPVQIGPGTHPASVQWVRSPFPGGKAWFLTTTSADVTDRVQLHLYSSSEPSRPVLAVKNEICHYELLSP